MTFLVDAQLPRRLAHRLRDRGHIAFHTLDLERGNRTPDRVLSAIADTGDLDRLVLANLADIVAAEDEHRRSRSPASSSTAREIHE